jgi:hypothetical protein
VAESDSDTTLGLEQHREQIPLCRQRTSPKSSKRKMSDSPSRQPNYNDDSPSTNRLQENDGINIFFTLFCEKEQNEKKRKLRS